MWSALVGVYHSVNWKKCDKNNGYFTWRRLHAYKNISLIHLRMRSVSGKACRENYNTYFSAHFEFSNFYPKSCCLWDVEKYGRDRKATDGHITRCSRISWWITKTRNTHAQNVSNLLLFQGNSGYTNAMQCYVYTYIAFLIWFFSATFIWILSTSRKNSAR